jgi:hypothetical protein
MSKPGLTALTASVFAILTVCPASAAPISSAQEGWAAISACARSPDDDARRDCMDGVLRRAGLLGQGPQAPAPTYRDDDRSKVLRLPLPAAPAAPAGELTVTKSLIDYDGRLLFVTSDGQRWRSQDIGAPKPKVGQAITIVSNIVGASECRLSKWDTFLCVKDGMQR